jgi:hypothetical protein
VIFVFAPLRTVIIQGGRGQQPECKKQPPDQPKPTSQTPKIREIENRPQQKGKGGKDSEETIRINSDLVNVVHNTSSASTRPTKNATALSAGSACEPKSPVIKRVREPVTTRQRIEERGSAAPQFPA